MLSVAVDVRGWSGRGRGIDLYVENLLSRWARLPDVQLTILAPRSGETPPPQSNAAVHRVSLTRVLLGQVLGISGLLSEALGQADAVFFPNFPIQRPHHRPFVVTAHDVTPLLHPEFFSRGDRRWHRLVRPAELLRAASSVLANSEQTRAEVLELGVQPDKVRVIYHGIGAEYRRADGDEVVHLREKHGLSDVPYFIYLGAVESRKNVRALVDGFEAARRQGLDAQLVIAGPVRDESQLATATSSVKVLGWVDPEDKVPLYAGAVAAISLAKHEGFGMLPLEAMACGTRSILTRLPVYDETIAHNATYVDNDEPEVVADALLTQLASPREIAPAEEARLKQKFSWDTCAIDTLAAIREAASSTSVDSQVAQHPTTKSPRT